MSTMILGRDGQVGHALVDALAPLGPVQALSRANYDLADAGQREALAQRIAQDRPTLIVNAAAYTAVDRAESEPALAHQVNAEAVGVIAQAAQRCGARLIHYSTDYVFDGSGTRPWREFDPTAPQSVYGHSKRAGEEAFLASGCRGAIFRTSWVHSVHGNNFVKTMLRLAQERDRLSVVADQIGAPTSARLIADITLQAVRALRAGVMSTGLYHLSAAGETSWHGLAAYAIERARAAGAPIKVTPGQIQAITTEDYPTAAKRPKNSRLDCRRLCDALGVDLPDWQVDVDQTVDGILVAR